MEFPYKILKRLNNYFILEKKINNSKNRYLGYRFIYSIFLSFMKTISKENSTNFLDNSEESS